MKKNEKLKKIQIELNRYLGTLENAFHKAIAAAKNLNKDHIIIDDVTIEDLYANHNYDSIDFQKLTQENLNELVGEIRLYINRSKGNSGLYQLYNHVIYILNWNISTENIFDEDGTLLVECYDPNRTFNILLLNKFYDYLKNLLFEYAQKDFNNYWYYLFEYYGVDYIKPLLESEQNSHSTQRGICSFYFKVFTGLRKNYDTSYRVEDGITFKATSYLGDKFPYLIISDQNGYNLTSQSEIFKKILQEKISLHFEKFTIDENKENFLRAIYKYTPFTSLNQDFIENNFHFLGSSWRNRMKNHKVPYIIPRNFVLLLRVLFEQNKIREVTKEDIIIWVEYEFKGIWGYKYNNIKDLLERGDLSYTRIKTMKEFANSLKGID